MDRGTCGCYIILGMIKYDYLTVIISTFPCSTEQSFLGSLLPERLRLSAAGGNDRQIAEQIAESGVHVGCAPAQKREAFRQGTRSLSGIEPKKTMAECPSGQKCAALRSGES